MKNTYVANYTVSQKSSHLWLPINNFDKHEAILLIMTEM